MPTVLSIGGLAWFSVLDKNVYRTAKKNDRNDLTIETMEKFCSSAAKLRSSSLVSIVKSFLSFFLVVRYTIFFRY